MLYPKVNQFSYFNELLLLEVKPTPPLLTVCPPLIPEPPPGSWASAPSDTTEPQSTHTSWAWQYRSSSTMLEEPQPGQLTPARDILQTARRPPRRQRRLNQRKKVHSELYVCANTLRHIGSLDYCRINKRSNDVNRFYDHRTYPARWWAVK